LVITLRNQTSQNTQHNMINAILVPLISGILISHIMEARKAKAK